MKTSARPFPLVTGASSGIGHHLAPRRTSSSAPTCSTPRSALGRKRIPADVAKTGFEAMMRGDGDVVRGRQNKLQTAIANITPAGALAALHAKDAEPGTAE